MKIFVCIKQVPDTETKITPNEANDYIDTSSIKWVMNPYDEFAVEQSLLIKANNTDSEVTVFRVGAKGNTEILRTAMAMGADKAVLVESNEILDSYATAKALKGAMDKSGGVPDIILMGKQAIDDDCLQVPQILAQLLDIPCVNVVIECNQQETSFSVKREIEGGSKEVYNIATPCIISANKGLNTPRYASLPGIMKAKKKPLEVYSLSDVGVSDDQKIVYANFHLPAQKAIGKKFEAMEDDQVAGVCSQVVDLIRNEAKAI